MTLLFLQGNTLRLSVGPLLDAATGAVVSDAEVTATLLRADATAPGGQDWPMTLEPRDGSPGYYDGTFLAAVDVTAGEALTITVVAVSPELGTARWPKPARVVERI